MDSFIRDYSFIWDSCLKTGDDDFGFGLALRYLII